VSTVDIFVPRPITSAPTTTKPHTQAETVMILARNGLWTHVTQPSKPQAKEGIHRRDLARQSRNPIGVIRAKAMELAKTRRKLEARNPKQTQRQINLKSGKPKTPNPKHACLEFYIFWIFEIVSNLGSFDMSQDRFCASNFLFFAPLRLCVFARDMVFSDVLPILIFKYV